MVGPAGGAALAAWAVEAPALHAPAPAVRTHNAGLVTDAHGALLRPGVAEGVVTSTTQLGWPDCLWSYRPVALMVTMHNATVTARRHSP